MYLKECAQFQHWRVNSESEQSSWGFFFFYFFVLKAAEVHIVNGFATVATLSGAAFNECILHVTKQQQWKTSHGGWINYTWHKLLWGSLECLQMLLCLKISEIGGEVLIKILRFILKTELFFLSLQVINASFCIRGFFWSELFFFLIQYRSEFGLLTFKKYIHINCRDGEQIFPKR